MQAVANYYRCFEGRGAPSEPDVFPNTCKAVLLYCVNLGRRSETSLFHPMSYCWTLLHSFVTHSRHCVLYQRIQPKRHAEII